MLVPRIGIGKLAVRRIPTMRSKIGKIGKIGIGKGKIGIRRMISIGKETEKFRVRCNYNEDNEDTKP